MRHYWRLSSAVLLAGAVSATDVGIASASSNVQGAATMPAGLPATLQPYMKTVLAMRGTTDEPGQVESLGGPEHSAGSSAALPGQTALISDAKGEYVLSVSPIPQTSAIVVVSVATTTGLTTWVFKSGSSIPVSGPVSATMGPSQVISPSVSSVSPSISGTGITSNSVNGSNGKAGPLDEIDKYCTITTAKVDVVTTEEFGPLLHGFSDVVCDSPAVIGMTGQLQEAGLNLKWNSLGSPGGTLDDYTTGLIAVLNDYDSCGSSSNWPFRQRTTALVVFEGTDTSESALQRGPGNTLPFNCL